MNTRTYVFGSHNVLSGLPREYATGLLARARPKFLKRGQTLFESGAVANGCYWIEEGVLKVSVVSQEGTERILAILGPGSIVGELAMIDGLPRSATIQALRDARLTFVPREVFLEFLRDHPEMYRHLVSILVARLRNADEEAAAASFLPLRARLARALLQFAEYLGEPTETLGHLLIPHKIRQDDLAALADVTRESVSRILSEWRERRMIHNRSSGVYVVHEAKLKLEARFFG
jgi:CRP/FNR family transcriptional regulator, cyclic AMP receptor protein